MNPGKHVAVLGLGESGYQSALFLQKKGFEVFVSENQSSDAILQRAEALGMQGIECETGEHTLERILRADWILISPGISPRTEIYGRVRQKGIPVFSEIEAASWYSASQKIIAVTGSSGKTTVTTLLKRIFEEEGLKAASCGNIGNPWIGEADRIDAETHVILELSSFQLQHCFRFRPHVGIVLNITPNHLDWHASMEEYAAAKWRIFANQEEKDIAFLRKKDFENYLPSFFLRAQTFFLDADANANPNEDAVRRVGNLFKIRKQTVDKVLGEFTGLEHRLELAGVYEGVRYINDSKSTTTASLGWALEKYPDKKVILIAGGIAKSRDHGLLKDLIGRKAKKVILIGEASAFLREAWEGAAVLEEALGLREAVERAVRSAVSGDIVLLSPACSSFDMFRNYQERGRQFKQYIESMGLRPLSGGENPDSLERSLPDSYSTDTLR